MLMRKNVNNDVSKDSPVLGSQIVGKRKGKESDTRGDW